MAQALEAAALRFSLQGRELAWFVAQCAHETGGLLTFRENLNYSSKRLLAVFPGVFRGREHLAAQIAGDPQRTANVVYGNRGGNGDEESGDGWAYRGGGPVMLTFRENYHRYGDLIGVDLESYHDKIEEQATGWLAAAAFWDVRCRKALPAGYDMISKRINPGESAEGLQRRRRFLAACERHLGGKA